MHSINAVTVALLFGLAGCSLLREAPKVTEAVPEAAPPPRTAAQSTPAPAQPSLEAASPAPTEPPAATLPGTVKPLALPRVRTVSFRDLPNWQQDDHARAWPALLNSCRVLKDQAHWEEVCKAAVQLGTPDAKTARAFFERHFTPHQVLQNDGSPEGLVTGYYEPLLRGSRTPSDKYRYPLYGPPDDLLVVDLSTVYPELKNLRLRGRLDGQRVVPYFDRAGIENGLAPVKGRELLWVDDPVELFFLHIQGSGRVRLDTGETVRIGYADHNGHPYRSIGKWLVDNGELSLDRASMQGIKEWGRRNPQRLTELLNVNPSYVFFRELPDSPSGPLGALGVPLTAGRSIAVDPSVIPLGAPVWLATTRPNSSVPLERLMLAQDTGGAIRGNVRADFFWGFGDEAGQIAGAMKQRGRMWLLLPRDYPVARQNGNGT
ncbi:MAG: MltA domain-containing protein [Thiobacillaceae bacterium]